MKRNSIFNEDEVKRYKKTVEEYDQAVEECEKITSPLPQQINDLEAETNTIQWPEYPRFLGQKRIHLKFLEYAEKINAAFVSRSQVMVSSHFHRSHGREYVIKGAKNLDKKEEADLIDPEWRKNIKDHKVIKVKTSTIVWAEDHLELTAQVGPQRQSFLVKDIVGDIRRSGTVCFVYDFNK